MEEFSILIGGQAGDGIRKAGNLIGCLFNQFGYWIFIYDDYPSLIRGGHNFSIIRASSQKILAHKDKIDLIVALNQDTIRQHYLRFTPKTLLIYDADVVKTSLKGTGLPMESLIKKNHLPPIVKNTIALGVLARIFSLSFSVLEKLIKESFDRELPANLKAARLGYDWLSLPKLQIKKLSSKPRHLLTGNEAVALGAVKAGLENYFAYPMTPATSILHFLAAKSQELGVKVVQPENEIAVALMAAGAAFAGKRAMVGTSGGGFSLMVESLSLAGQAEIPLLFVLSQRPGPATGVPTYTAQGDLYFALKAGHGEFPRIVLAPGDLDEAFYLAAEALNFAWQFQTPVILLLDKHLSESTFSATFKENLPRPVKPKIWQGKGIYQRYKFTKDGISPLAFPGTKNIVVKTTSYEHQESGITTEESKEIKAMIDKRNKKAKAIRNTVLTEKAVNIAGSQTSKIALLCWGSVKGAVFEVAEKLGFKMVQPLFLEPFPGRIIKKHLASVEKVIDIETNSTAQLSELLQNYGIALDKKILKYDGRPFSVDELEREIKKIL